MKWPFLRFQNEHFEGFKHSYSKKNKNHKTTYQLTQMRKDFIQTNLLTLIGVLAGALGGYLYWRYIGCASGSCPITSSPLYSSIWGAAIGGLLLNIFQKPSKKKK